VWNERTELHAPSMLTINIYKLYCKVRWGAI
jgi:hypothetical protein